MLEVAELVTTFLGWLGGVSVTLMLLAMIDPGGERPPVIGYGVASVLLAVATVFMLANY